MFKSIRTRLIGTYLFIIIATVFTIAIFLCFWVDNYYKSNIENYIKGQIEVVADVYKNSFIQQDLSKNTRKIIKNFSKMPVQVQIIDINGMVVDELVDSGVTDLSKMKDVTEALKNKSAKYETLNKDTNEAILAYSVPLRYDDSVVGIIRVVTSLEETYKIINQYYLYIVGLSTVIVMLVFLISFFVARSIVNPILDITKTASEMAKGNINAKARKFSDDEIGKSAEALNYLWAELQKNQKVKNEFISTISHELRTPITSIKGWALTLKDTDVKDKEELERGLDIINSEADRFKGMIEDLLDFSKLESGKFEIYKDTTNIKNLILSVVDQMQPRANRLKIKINLKFDTFYDEVEIDEKRIRQVLINIVDNAFRYVKEDAGEIRIETSISKEDKDQYYEIRVSDNGCGIPEEELPLIKQKFYRGKNNDKSTGTGIGLSICDEIVKMHNGRLEIKSKQGEGTIVEILLPLNN